MTPMIGEGKINIQIKGIKDGLLVIPAEGDWSVVQEALLSHIDQQSSFFQGAKVALDVGNQILRAAELGELRDRLGDKGVILWTVLSNSPTTEQTAQMLGIATRLSVPRTDRVVRALDTNLSGDEAILVQRTLRSGFKVSFHGHIVVIGDVNPGAEIVASGSVVIWGKMKGVVHAGAEGNEKAVVCALDLAPMQLRIAGVIAAAQKRKGKPRPEMARFKEGQVLTEYWEGG